jgi:outer membrane protein assembly factor BamB
MNLHQPVLRAGLYCSGLFLSTFIAAQAGEPLGDWPHWRGPLATGAAPHGEPPITWDENTNVKWKVPIPGLGNSTPIVWGDQVFILTAVDTGRPAAPGDIPKPDPRFQVRTTPPTTYFRFVVLCFDRATGQVRWERVATEQVPHEGLHPSTTYAAASPTTDGRSLFVSFGSRGLYCYDLAGNLRWKRDLGRLHTRLGWGEGSSPTIHGDALAVNWDQEADSCAYALDARTGETRWKVSRDEPTSWATPLVVEHNGRTQVVLNGTKRVRSYDLDTGRLVWECGGQTLNAIPSPLLAGNLVICMTGYQGTAAYAIPLDATGDLTGTGKVAWHHDRGTPYVPSPLLVGDRLYFTQANNALLTCLDVKTGKPHFDRQRLPGLTSLYASPVAAGGRIYIPSREGATLVIKDADRLEVLGINRLGDPIDASPAVAGRQLFLRTAKSLYCLEGN